MDNQLNEVQQQALNETLEAGSAFEELIRTKGFELLKGRYEQMLRTFVNNLMNSDQPIETFESERQRLVGIKQLFSNIESTLEVTRNERSK